MRKLRRFQWIISTLIHRINRIFSYPEISCQKNVLLHVRHALHGDISADLFIFPSQTSPVTTAKRFFSEAPMGSVRRPAVPGREPADVCFLTGLLVSCRARGFTRFFTMKNLKSRKILTTE